MRQLHALVDAGNTVVVVEHDMAVVAGADHVVDMGRRAGTGAAGSSRPERRGGGQDGRSRTAPYLAKALRR